MSYTVDEFLDGRVTLFGGDAVEVMRDMKAASVDLIVTDPPFRVISGGTGSRLADRFKGVDIQRPTGILAKNDGKIFKHNDVKSSDYLPECYRVLRSDRDCYVMTNNLNLRTTLNDAEKCGFKFHGLLTWNKNTCTPSRWYMKDLELVLYLYKGAARPINNPGDKQSFPCDNPRDKQHPTEKPVELMQRYIGNSTKRGWKVLDPFMGSGSAGVAALNAGCRFIGVEIDRAYLKVAQRRLAAANDNEQINSEDAIRAAA